MSNIEELTKQLCPDGVEYKELWEVTGWDKKFNGLDKHMQKRVINYPYVLANKFKELELERGNVRLLSTGNYIGWTTEELAGKNLCVGEIVAIPWGGKANVKYYKGKFVTADNRIATSLDTDVLLNKFLYYWMLVNNELIEGFYRGSGIKHPSMKSVLTMQIPLPPLPIQQEIVAILDKFIHLETELQSELQARRAQYEYYMNELLNFEGKEVMYRTLGEISTILRGTAITKKETISGEFPVVANSPNPIYFHGKSNRSGETIVIARSGAYSGLVSYWNMPFFLTDAFSIHPDNTLFKTKFVYFLLKNEQEKIHNMKKGSGVPHVRAMDFESYSIPIPPLSEQERIVSILDKLESLVNDKSVGLPAEIEARRKQYEYYRGKLLDFKNINNG